MFWGAVASVATAIATVVTQLVVFYQLRQQQHKTRDELRRQQGETRDKLEQVHHDINGRVDQLVHEARKTAALEAITPSDAD